MMTKKQRNAIMRSRNTPSITERTYKYSADDYYHKQSAYTIIGWLLCAAVVAFIICGVIEWIK